jgi:hypothetical protein
MSSLMILLLASGWSASFFDAKHAWNSLGYHPSAKLVCAIVADRPLTLQLMQPSVQDDVLQQQLDHGGV